MFDSDTPNQLRAKRKRRQQKRRQHRDSKGADKGLTNRQTDQEGRGAWNRTGRGAQATLGDARKCQMLTQEEAQIDLEEC